MSNTFFVNAPASRIRRPAPKNSYHEDSLQRQVCHYLKLQYPRVIFRSDLDSGRNKSSDFEKHRMRAMNSSRSFPDLFIYEPMQHKDKFYSGLALELKKEGTTVILKTGPNKGKISSNPHIQEQALLLKELSRKGYYANFAVGIDEAIRTIDWYFKKPINASIF